MWQTVIQCQCLPFQACADELKCFASDRSAKLDNEV